MVNKEKMANKEKEQQKVKEKEVKEVTSEEEKIRSLLVRGFSKNEVVKLLGVQEEAVGKVVSAMAGATIQQSSIGLYDEMQKDLAKLVLKELNRDGGDTQSVLSAIKLQAELQEKKLALAQNAAPVTIAKDYLYDRDEKIMDELNDLGFSDEAKKMIAKKYGISIHSLNLAIDRVGLGLTLQAKAKLAPTIISETIGLPTPARIKILEQAAQQGQTRQQVRQICNAYKNSERGNAPASANADGKN